MNSATSSRSVDTGLRRDGLRRAARALVRGRAVSAARGFTLTEILIAIALILIIGGLAVANFIGMADSVGQQSPPKALQSMIREARFLAMERRDPVVLTHNDETHSFDLDDTFGNVLEQQADGVTNDQSKLILTFTPILPLNDITADPNSEDLNSDDLSKKPPLTYLVFDPSGVTKPVKVTMTIDQGTPLEYRLDPFSEGPPPKAPENLPPIPTE